MIASLIDKDPSQWDLNDFKKLINLYLSNANEANNAEFLTLSNNNIIQIKNIRRRRAYTSRAYSRKCLSHIKAAETEIGDQLMVSKRPKSTRARTPHKLHMKRIRSLMRRVDINHSHNTFDNSLDRESNNVISLNDSVHKIEVPENSEPPQEANDFPISEIELAISPDAMSSINHKQPESPKFGASVSSVSIKKRAKTPRIRKTKRASSKCRSISSYSNRSYSGSPSYMFCYNPKTNFARPVANLWAHVIRMNREVAKKTKRMR